MSFSSGGLYTALHLDSRPHLMALPALDDAATAAATIGDNPARDCTDPN